MALATESTTSFDNLLKRVELLSADKLHTLMRHARSIQASRRKMNLYEHETQLLLAINQALTPEFSDRLSSLKAKLNAETINDSEHKELLKMIEKLETFDANRLENLGKLARLRGVGLKEVMQELDIRK